jgi:hypothetical protein
LRIAQQLTNPPFATTQTAQRSFDPDAVMFTSRKCFAKRFPNFSSADVVVKKKDKSVRNKVSLGCSKRHKRKTERKSERTSSYLADPFNDSDETPRTTR